MSNWMQYVEDSREHKHRGRKYNKNYICKKNKLGGGKYGPHIYEGDGDTCTLCQHFDKSRQKTLTFDTLTKTEKEV